MTPHLEPPYGQIESGKDFLERIAVQFGLDYLDAIKATQDPKLALEFAKAAAGFADGAESERAQEVVDACFKAASAKSARFPLIPFEDIKPDGGIRYLIKGLLQSTGLVVVWGPPKCGKSFWTFDALMHVALGWPYRGHRVNSGPVVYCALEGVQGFKNRVEAFRRAKLSEDDKVNPAFYLVTASLSLVRDKKALMADIRKQLGVVKPAVVCIDTLNRSLEGSESSDEDMAAYIRAADAIREAFHCLVVIVHHCGHDERRPRGHSSLIAAVDTQIAISRDAAGNIVAEVELSKDGEIGLTFVSRLKVVDIGVDQDDDPITSCVVEAVESPMASEAGKKGKKQSKPHQAMIRALRRAIEEVGEQVTSNTIPRSVRVVRVDTWRLYAYQAGISPTNTEDSNRMAFNRAHKALVNADTVKAHNEYRWLPD
jgi:hypothetical protein